VDGVPAGSRKLVTGHESLGWFARRYGFTVVGAVIPSLSTQAEVSAGQLASLKKVLREHPVTAVFTETGTPKQVVEALARELGVRAVALNTHALVRRLYATFMRELARTVCVALRRVNENDRPFIATSSWPAPSLPGSSCGRLRRGDVHGAQGLLIGDALAESAGIAVALLLRYPGCGRAAGSALMVGGIGYYPPPGSRTTPPSASSWGCSRWA
jgi:hypothetical protein